MLVITLGTQASGSTWLFNVVRSLLDAAGQPFFSCSSDDGADALDQMPLDVSSAVLKAHGMDQRLIRLARLTSAKIIISTRDPRDSVVSQFQRFRSTVHQASVDLSKALASIRSLPQDLSTLRFIYENGFTNRRQTVEEVASFLGISVSSAVIDTIFETYQSDSVRARILEMVSAIPPEETPCHDPETHWHPAHLGDGRTGKWRDHLNDATRDVISGCLTPLETQFFRTGGAVRWSAELFSCNTGENDQPTVLLPCPDEADFLCYGPYLYIPRGRWRAIPRIRVAAFCDVRLEADIYLPWNDRQLAHQFGKVSRTGAPDLTLQFDHEDHFQPLEARLRSITGSGGNVSFSGWSLYWLGALN